MATAGQNASSPGSRTCVVGSGPLGLVAAKNLREQGLDVTIFTRDEHIGGLWHFSNDKSKTTALTQTSFNTSGEVVRI
jgi:dimethylaniline monooxygenase (N-oxide forming)